MIKEVTKKTMKKIAFAFLDFIIEPPIILLSKRFDYYHDKATFHICQGSKEMHPNKIPSISPRSQIVINTKEAARLALLQNRAVIEFSILCFHKFCRIRYFDQQLVKVLLSGYYARRNLT